MEEVILQLLVICRNIIWLDVYYNHRNVVISFTIVVHYKFEKHVQKLNSIGNENHHICVFMYICR